MYLISTRVGSLQSSTTQEVFEHAELSATLIQFLDLQILNFLEKGAEQGTYPYLIIFFPGERDLTQDQMKQWVSPWIGGKLIFAFFGSSEFDFSSEEPGAIWGANSLQGALVIRWRLPSGREVVQNGSEIQKEPLPSIALALLNEVGLARDDLTSLTSCLY